MGKKFIIIAIVAFIMIWSTGLSVAELSISCCEDECSCYNCSCESSGQICSSSGQPIPFIVSDLTFPNIITQDSFYYQLIFTYEKDIARQVFRPPKLS